MNSIKSILPLFLLVFIFSCQRSGVSRDLLRISLSKSQKIIGGVTAGIGEFPFVVNIGNYDSEHNYVKHLCGGSLVHSKWVLTAAHCVVDEESEVDRQTIKKHNLRLYIGSNKINGSGGDLLKVKSILIHPQYSWPKHDVALLELESPVRDIAPVLLNKREIESSISQISLFTVVGWGFIDKEGKTNAQFLQKISLPLISREACAEDDFIQKLGWQVTSDMLCVKTFNNQKASCIGDSGGPLFYKRNNQYFQIGVVSWGSACSGYPPRFYSNVEGYADVSDAYPWIKESINSN